MLYKNQKKLFYPPLTIRKNGLNTDTRGRLQLEVAACTAVTAHGAHAASGRASEVERHAASEVETSAICGHRRHGFKIQRRGRERLVMLALRQAPIRQRYRAGLTLFTFGSPAVGP